MNAPTPAIGQPVSRVDGPAKVTGTARYAGEFAPDGLAYAAVVTSTIPKGRIRRIDTTAAETIPGVLAVVSHLNAPSLPYHEMEKRPQVDPKSGDQLQVFQGPDILFNGQPVAAVVAQTQEIADAAASCIGIAYEEAEARTVFDPGRGREPSEETAKGGRPGASGRGDADGALAGAAVTVDAAYVQAREHHNAIEPHVTIASWEGDRLTLYDKTQWVQNVVDEIAHVFGMDKEKIRVISPFVGGAFGSALRTWPHVTIAAIAARMAGRPVRVELSRRQLYNAVGYRPHTEQRVRLGADRDGKLTAIVQEAAAQVATYEEYAETTLQPAETTYSCPNVRTAYRLVEMDVNSPCPMRGPGIVTGLYALEAAMDELAFELGMDPVELRLRNHADTNEKTGQPWSSKELRTCYETGAERFGWANRIPEPRSMRVGTELVGYGMATAIYHADRGAAEMQATVFANGTAVIRSAASDMGPGTYTSITQIAADALGLPVDAVRFELGDSDLPTAPVHGGSITLASVGTAASAACEALRDKLDRLPAKGGSIAETLRANSLDRLDAKGKAAPGEETKTHASSAFGAVFVEVRVDEGLGAVRVKRMVGAYDVGRVVNPKIARSQCIGGMMGGIGMALMEQAEWDERFGKVMNANLAEYLVPVCADTPDLDVVFVPGEDTIFNPLGAKGLAEIAICGVAPAITSAVFHATGRRIRHIPIMAERVIG
ncbi:xanthine dehydrogenase family protein molybdopterin-binding subunit [Chthonobacter rhizosphaerae]|uniref:xanthine dehydrogenase family protein molybdopterin-binding subunit n=1 Tax=Chthonobacter rhizosphaerae TaxID=2735553 RepID=UPI0015EE3E67|nr:xanthine dehydrogenase family protein molybdopterin-binding subunit [Chthonobacter rhizosphaerae]